MDTGTTSIGMPQAQIPPVVAPPTVQSPFVRANLFQQDNCMRPTCLNINNTIFLRGPRDGYQSRTFRLVAVASQLPCSKHKQFGHNVRERSLIIASANRQDLPYLLSAPHEYMEPSSVHAMVYLRPQATPTARPLSGGIQVLWLAAPPPHVTTCPCWVTHAE